MDKKEELAKLEVSAKKTLNHPGTNLVFGEGNPDSQVLFIGEAPGFNEDRLGRPFVGQAGRLLDKALADAGIKREDVYITNVLKNRPPENRDPLPAEIEEAAPFLDQQLAIISPDVVVTLGRFSMGKFLPGVKISQVHGEPKRVGRYLIVPMFHPAAALRNPAVLRLFEEDFRKLPEIIENRDSYKAPGQDPNQLSLI